MSPPSIERCGNLGDRGKCLHFDEPCFNGRADYCWAYEGNANPGRPSPEERALLYSNRFPDWPPLQVVGGRLFGIWHIGNDYRNKTEYHGAYPRSYLPRVMSMFPDMQNVLHAFSGSLPPGPYTRVDLLQPAEVNCSVESLPDDWTGCYDLAMADPPYTKKDAEIYGTPMPVGRRCTLELARVLRPGGWLVWLDTKWPQFRKRLLEHRGFVGVVRSTNHVVRLASFFERTEVDWEA